MCVSMLVCASECSVNGGEYTVVPIAVGFSVDLFFVSKNIKYLFLILFTLVYLLATLLFCCWLLVKYFYSRSTDLNKNHSRKMIRRLEVCACVWGQNLSSASCSHPHIGYVVFALLCLHRTMDV